MFIDSFSVNISWQLASNPNWPSRAHSQIFMRRLITSENPELCIHGYEGQVQGQGEGYLDQQGSPRHLEQPWVRSGLQGSHPNPIQNARTAINTSNVLQGNMQDSSGSRARSIRVPGQVRSKNGTAGARNLSPPMDPLRHSFRSQGKEICKIQMKGYIKSA